MPVWLVRAGGRGERQDLALDQNVAVIGWNELPDLSQFKTREDLEKRLPSVASFPMPSQAGSRIGSDRFGRSPTRSSVTI